MPLVKGSVLYVGVLYVDSVLFSAPLLLSSYLEMVSCCVSCSWPWTFSYEGCPLGCVREFSSATEFPARLWEVLSSGFFCCEGDALPGICEGDAL